MGKDLERAETISFRPSLARLSLKRAEALREELQRDIALGGRRITELGDQTDRKERGT